MRSEAWDEVVECGWCGQLLADHIPTWRTHFAHKHGKQDGMYSVAFRTRALA